MAIILDTSAWIEFFIGSERGRIVANTLKKEQTFTSIITFAEIANWCMKNNLESQIEIYINKIKGISQILDLNEDVTIISGKMNYERKKRTEKWGIMDSFIAATSLFYNLSILTKDIYFRDLPNAIILR